MKKIIAGLVAIALLSCAQKKELSSEEALKDSLETPEVHTDLYSDGRSKMIKTAECRFQVADMKKSKEAIITAIKKYSAYVETSNLEFQNPMLEEKITIRVLNAYFEDLLNEVTTNRFIQTIKKLILMMSPNSSLTSIHD